jgi:Transglycosylase-like domain/Putative peptidoglycan binding domain
VSIARRTQNGYQHPAAPKGGNKSLKRRAYVAGASLVGVAAASGLAPAAVLAKQPFLAQGSQGQGVAKVQKALGEQETGFFGPQTRQLVISYQKQHGLLVDGIVGPQTSGSLFSSKSDSGTNSHYKSHSMTTSTHHSSSGASFSSTGGGYSIPSSIVQCESGGNYQAVNPSTGAGGAYQIMPSTWRAYGGTGSPQSAPKAEQDAIASKIYQSSGGSQWSCK